MSRAKWLKELFLECLYDTQQKLSAAGKGLKILKLSLMFEIKDYDKVEMASFLGHDSLL